MAYGRQDGLTLIELMVAAGIAGVIAGLATISFAQWRANQALTTTTRRVADTLSFARMEAIRTGNVHVVYLSTFPGTDIAGNPIQDAQGNLVPVLILNDGPPGSPGQNCVIDAGEPIDTLPLVQGLAWGFTASAGVKAPLDSSLPGNASGSSFATPAGAPHNGFAFGPDGVPVAFDPGCVLGGFGTGNGGIYITNGQRDYAVVVQPLGGVRTHGFETSAGAWKN